MYNGIVLNIAHETIATVSVVRLNGVLRTQSFQCAITVQGIDNVMASITLEHSRDTLHSLGAESANIIAARDIGSTKLAVLNSARFRY